MKGKRGVYIDPEIHRKMRILAGRDRKRIFEMVEEACRRFIGKMWNKKAAK